MGAEAGRADRRAFEQTQITHGRFVKRREGDFLLLPSPARSFSSPSTLAGTDAEYVQHRNLREAGRVPAAHPEPAAAADPRLAAYMVPDA